MKYFRLPYLIGVGGPVTFALLLYMLISVPARREERWVASFLPALDPVTAPLCQAVNSGASVPASFDALLAPLPASVQDEARRAPLTYQPSRRGYPLVLSGRSWGATYRLNAVSACWERWEEDYVAEPRWHCLP